MLLFSPFIVSANTLTPNQVNSIVMLLQAFGVDQTTITTIENDISPTPISVQTPEQFSTPTIETSPQIVASSIELVSHYPQGQVSQNIPQEADLPGICDSITLWPVVFDQNGNQIANPSATFINPETHVSTTYAWFQYTPTAINTTETLQYSDGDLSGLYTITIGSTSNCSN